MPSIIFNNFPTNLGAIAHNVPAVCDGLAARIRALRSKDQGWQNVPEQRRGNGAQRNDLAVAEAEGALASEAHTACYTSVKPEALCAPGFMSYNVPSVCDGLAARIRKCAAFTGPANCAGATAWEWSAAE
jgi:hypothetical protein